jgi:GxxExxY protein
MDQYNVNTDNLKYQDLTQVIIGCAFEVINELGIGFLESVYEKAMLVALQHNGVAALAQQSIRVNFRGENVGDFYADILVENKIVLELKAVKSLLPQHHAQIINYLNATGFEVGLLINFGKPKLEYRRFRKKN